MEGTVAYAFNTATSTGTHSSALYRNASRIIR